MKNSRPIRTSAAMLLAAGVILNQFGSANAQANSFAEAPTPERIAVLRFDLGKIESKDEKTAYAASDAFVTLISLGLAHHGLATIETDTDIVRQVQIEQWVAAKKDPVKEAGRNKQPDIAVYAEAGRRLRAEWTLTGEVKEEKRNFGLSSQTAIRARLINTRTGEEKKLKSVILSKQKIGLAGVGVAVASVFVPVRELATGLTALAGIAGLKSALSRDDPQSAELRRSPVYQTLMRASYEMGFIIAETVPTTQGRIIAVDQGQPILNIGSSNGIKSGMRFTIFELSGAGSRKDLQEAEAVEVSSDQTILRLVTPAMGAPQGVQVMIKEGHFARRRPLVKEEWEAVLKNEAEQAKATTSKPK